jgi:hypothetical protein
LGDLVKKGGVGVAVGVVYLIEMGEETDIFSEAVEARDPSGKCIAIVVFFS